MIKRKDKIKISLQSKLKRYNSLFNHSQKHQNQQRGFIQQQKVSKSRISQKIIRMKPYSVLEYKSNIDKDINQIYDSYKYSIRQQSQIDNTQSTKKTSYLQKNQRIISIIKNLNKIKPKRRQKDQQIQQKNHENQNKDAEQQIANNLILQSKAQRIKLRKTMNNYHQFMQNPLNISVKNQYLKVSLRKTQQSKSIKQIQQKKKIVKKFDEQKGQPYKVKNIKLKNEDKNTWVWLRSLKKVCPTEYSQKLIKVENISNENMYKRSKTICYSHNKRQHNNTNYKKLKQKVHQAYLKNRFCSIPNNTSTITDKQD